MQDMELADQAAFLKSILESSTEYSIIAEDLQGRILAWNEGARRNYGYTAEEAIGRLNTRILHTAEDVRSGRVESLLETALRTGKAEGVFDRVRKNGSRFTASVAVSLRRDAVGKPIGFVLISKDITEQKALEEELRRKNQELQEQNRRVQEANRLKSEFLANMSHELRTPLNSIIGFSELMHDGKAGDLSATYQEYLGDILESARHLLQLINDVLDLAKVESGKLEFRPEPVALPKLIGEVRDTLRTLASQKRIAIRIETDPGVDDVRLDPSKFKQVLYNYLSNALKFTPDGGSVTVRVKPEEGARFRLEVEDSGIGIRKEDLHRLFVEFQQLDGGTAKKYPGTGLGLALTKRIVEAQGGEVGVRSVPGKGSTFFATLPRVAAGAPEPRSESPERPTILVIEDDERDRRRLLDTLQAAGYGTAAAATAQDALQQCRARKFDAITLNLILPDLGGWALLREIRAAGLNRSTPLIAVTIAAQRKAAAVFRIHDVIAKPVKPKAVLESLARAGLRPGRILIIYDDPRSLKLARNGLRDAGWQPVCASDAAAGLSMVETERPVAIVLDPLMPGMDGFEFLERLRKEASGSATPVVIWTVKELTEDESARLHRQAQAVVDRTDGSLDALIAELRRQLAGIA